MTQNEVAQEANRIRSLHKVPAVVVYVIEAEECPLGFAIAKGLEGQVLPLLPGKLREIADVLERQIAAGKQNLTFIHDSND